MVETPQPAGAGDRSAEARPVAPIAVLGTSCRFPQAGDPGAFWRLLARGGDAVGDVPPGRWPGSAADGHRRGAFLDDVEGFDAAFFGISPLEAAATDPQQRLALELAWEAVEDAGLLPASLRGSSTGVFVGAVSQEYAVLQDRAGGAGRHGYTGGHRTMIANRVSYVLGLAGPSLTVDTGQSSSLVAVHLACESLRRGESQVALAGGVDLHLLAEGTAAVAAMGALSAGGRCRPFDRDADGYVRGEGGGLVLLKPLADALRDGDRVVAVLLGSAVNNDGGGEGLTVPRAAAQAEVVDLALRRAGRAPADVGYVELHGTGTPVGDPVEARALGEAIGRRRHAGAGPLPVGSVKTNIGHLEGAAGIAGLLKVVLGLAHGQLPASLHFTEPNPAVPLAELGLEVVTAPRPWPEERRVAGVSAFGMGGTNCHVVVGGAPVADPPAAAAPGTPWLLSARSAPALRGQAAALAALPAADPGAPDAGQVAAALAHGRTRFEHRAVVLDGDRAGALAALAADRPHPDLVTGRALRGGTAFVFPGQGAQWTGMAAALTEELPAFAEALAACGAALAPYVDWSPEEVLRGVPGGPDPERVDVVQPALWAVMVALAGAWQAAGVVPDVVVGHSQGEIAAATVAGALSVDDAARVVALRSRALVRIAGSGGMLSVTAPVDEVASGVHRAVTGGAALTVAAVNGPRSVVVSGPVADLARFAADLTQAGFEARPVAVDYASHSAAVEPLEQEVLAALAPVRPRTSSVPLVSTLTGARLDTTVMDAGYWYRSLRSPVRFSDAVLGVLHAGAAVLVECSPHPVLTGAVEETAEEARRPVAVLGTLRRGQGGLARFRRALAEADVAGAPVRWAGPAPAAGRLAAVPTYAFDRRRHWLADGTPLRALTPRAPADDVAEVDVDGPARPASRGRVELRELVLGLTAEVLGHRDAREVPADRTFTELGVDSASAVHLRNRLRAATGLDLPTGLLFDHPSPDRLVDHLVARSAGGAATGCATALAAPAPADADDPVVVVAMGCRFPGGVRAPEDLWRLVAEGGEAITEFPTNRGWDLDRLTSTGPDRSGTSDTRFGGFLHDADQFDAAFFGIGAREAAAMDPQQRLLLEVSWETLERAGVDPTGLGGTPTGVFVGAMYGDYGPRLHLPGSDLDGHLLTGTALSVLSGRIAYQLGLQGPALTIDTACSSSLVAIHLAVQALRRGECTLALAGGAAVMSNPGLFVEFSRRGGLAADGRCKPFSAAADGTAWAEGAGMLLLERRSAALAAGHPVLAVVRGGAVNQDGRSNGLTAPNGPSQEHVILDALRDSGLTPHDVDVVEAHGTGTRLGDPIEARALMATYGQGRPADRPLWLGSLKSNIGHSQAAAGVAGVIKMVLALQHRTVPRTLHAEEPTPQVDWAGGGVRLAGRPVELRADRPLRAAVSSFGISGTNAHVVLEEAPATPTAPDAAHGDAPGVWLLSARTDAALRGLAGRLAAHAVTAPAADLVATAHVLSRRAVLDRRAAVVAGDRDELVAGLTALAGRTPHPAVVTGEGPAGVRPVFVFPGQGSQWAGMAVELLASRPAFAAEMERCDRALAPHTGWSVLAVLRQEDGAPALEGTDVVQPALFAVMVSLAALWRSVGVEPEVVLGHSQGEIAAACVAGALDLADAARVVARRSAALLPLAGTGGMLAVAAPVDRAVELIAPWADRVWPAIVNGPSSSVVAGDPEALDALVAACTAAGVRTSRVPVDYASHTPHVEVLREEVLRRLEGVTPRATDVRFCSSVTGQLLDPAELTTPYWYRGLRQPVRFRDAVETCAGAGSRVFLEMSPHPVLTGHVDDVLRALPAPGAASGTLRRGDGGDHRFLTALAEAAVLGVRVDWGAVLPGTRRSCAGVPTYPFEHERFWAAAGTEGDAAVTGEHPLLGTVLEVPGDGGLVAAARWSTALTPWLADHAVTGTTIAPGTALVELALAAGDRVGCDRLADLTLEAPLTVPATGAVQVQVTVSGPGPDDLRALAVHTRAGDDQPWTRVAQGSLGRAAAEVADAPTAWPPAGATPVDLAGAYDDLAEHGYGYGPAFQGLRAAWRGPAGELWAEVELPADAGAPEVHLLHPALLDAALHPLVLDRVGRAALALPFSWRDVVVPAAGAGALRVRLALLGEDRVALAAWDDEGRAVAAVGELVLRAVPSGAPAAPAVPAARTGAVAWVPRAPEGAAAPGTWAVVDPEGDPGGLVDGLRAAGIEAGLGYDLPSLPDLVAGDVPGTVLVPVPLPEDAGDDVPYALREVLGGVLELVQTWLGDARFDGSRLVLLTRGGTAAGPVTAAPWGLVRSAAREHPGRFALVDLGPGTAPAGVPWQEVAALLADGEPEVAVRAGAVLVPRLRPLADAQPAGDEVPAGDPAEGTVLVTGGTGGLGALVAERLVAAHGVRHLLLASRSGERAAGVPELTARLAALGAEVTVTACDVSDRRAVAALLAAIPAGRPLTGVVHTAGAVADTTVAALTAGGLDTVLAPKADAAWHLHELTGDLPVGRFVLFSSVAGVLGNPGQSGYAAANAALDALAAHRRDAGLPAVSVAWGLWALPTGLTERLADADVDRLARSGLVAMATEDGLAAFDRAWRAGADDPAAVVAAAWDPRRLRAAAGDATLPPVLRELAPPVRRAPARATGSAPGAGPAGAGDALAAQLSGMAADAGRRLLAELVGSHVAAVLGSAGTSVVDTDRSFSEMGFDSLTAVELRNRLGAATGVGLPATVAFDHPTVPALAEHLHRSLAPAPPSAEEVLRQALDQVGRLLPTAPDERAAVLAVLRGHLARWDDGPGAQPAAAVPAQEIRSASDDEIFAFIDSQL